MTPSRSRGLLARGVRTVVLTAICVGAGAVTSLAFPPLGRWWAAPVGVAGLFLLTGAGTGPAGSRPTASAVTLPRALWRGVAWGLGLFVPLLHFTAVSMGNPLGWVALSVLEALYLGGLGLAWAGASRLPRLRRDGALACLLRVVVFAVLFTGVEELRASWPWGGFPFGRLAFSQADSPLLPLAAYGGSTLLTAGVALVGAAGGQAVAAVRHLRLLRALALGVMAVAVTLAPMLAPLGSVSEDGTVRIGAVQGALPPVARTGAGAEEAFHRALEVTGRHTQATEALAEQTGRGSLDVVVWPENAADRDPRTDADSRALVEAAARAVGAPVIVGAVPYEDREDATRVRYNDMVVWEPGLPAAQDAQRPYYRKHRPVPFGEWVPWREQIRRVTDQVDRVSVDLLPGTGPTTLTVHGPASGREVTLAMGICFEVAYDSVLREGVVGGGEVIVIPTNNASFGTSTEAAQQLEQGRVQAVVHGRAVVQVSTVGITAVISPKGVVTQQLPAWEQGALVADVPLRRSLTVADRLGPWPGRLALAATGVLALAGLLTVACRRRAGA